MELKQGVDYRGLADLVDENGGVITVKMGQMRDLHGAGKLGSTVVTNISTKLENAGIGHSPKELPSNQYSSVLLFRKGTDVGKVIEAATVIDENSAGLIKDVVKGGSDGETIRKIRELVSD